MKKTPDDPLTLQTGSESMASGTAVGEGQILRIIRDLHELAKEYKENGEPITDDCSNLHKFSHKLEYLLQFDQKEKSTFLGSRKDYWDYFCDCLAKIKGANDGIRFVKSIPETSLGKGRGFLRYSLVHQRLADTLQQCLMNHRVTRYILIHNKLKLHTELSRLSSHSDWYSLRSPFHKANLSADIINSLYELNDVQFDVASRGYDLDAEWPTFARRTLGMVGSPSHTWKPPSRSSSINSLASTYSQVLLLSQQQPLEFPGSPDFGAGLLSDVSMQSSSVLNESSMSAVDELRLELDQSELKQRELLSQFQELGEEAGELRGVVVELQRQLDVSLAAQSNHQELQRNLERLAESERVLSRELEILKEREASHKDLQDVLAAAERKNEELITRLDGALDEKEQRVASDLNSAQKIHELLKELKEAEKARIEALAEVEERRKQVEHLTEKVKVKDEELEEAGLKMAAWMEKGEQWETKEKETRGLQKKLEACQNLLETVEKQAHEERKVLVENKAELEIKIKGLEDAWQTLLNELKVKESDLGSSITRVMVLEEELKNEKLKLGSSLKEHAEKIEEYKESCAKLTEQNTLLLQTAIENEESRKELLQSKSFLETELAGSRASEKQLRSQIEDAKVSVDEREQRMREENRSLDEQLQNASFQKKESQKTLGRLETENKELVEVQASLKSALTAMQAEIHNINLQIAELEGSLEVSRCNEANLSAQLKKRDSTLEDREKVCQELQERVAGLESRQKDLEMEKVQIEAALGKQTDMITSLETQKMVLEKTQLEQSACRDERASQLSLLEDQLALSATDVSRLQEEVLDLRAKLHSALEEKDKSRAKLDITETCCAELRNLTEQLKKQVEEQNRKHVEELLQAKERCDALASQLNQETSALKKVSAELASTQEELLASKAQNEHLALENGETRESLHRVNTETAELGMTICKLTAEREEAQERLVTDAAQIEELRRNAARETERLNASLVALRQENSSLREELKQMETLSEMVLGIKELLEKCEAEREAAREELAASLDDVNEGLRSQLDAELRKTSELEARASELEVQVAQQHQIITCSTDVGLNIEYSRLIEEKDAHITDCEASLREREGELLQLQETLSRSREAERERDEMKQKLDQVLIEAQKEHLQFTAELEDLGQTKTNLEERLIELIRDKDALWQKSDALEFEQKLRAEEQWWLVDKEATRCLGCQGQFTWWLRRHHCRLCGRIFCYYCSNNYVMTKNSKKERCCRECYTQHGAVTERFTRSELSSSTGDLPSPAYVSTPRVTVTDPDERADDGAFDIITEEEVNEIYDSDSRTTTGSHEEEGGDINTSSDVTPDEQEGVAPPLQDAEITLLQSGELRLVLPHMNPLAHLRLSVDTLFVSLCSTSVPLDLEDIPHFGDGSRELFVKSSCYSVIPITVGDRGPIISWVFSSEPKSISFTVVLIPLTRCNSHKETIQGQLKVRLPGVYLLVFDNSFSRYSTRLDLPTLC
ncbi:hypothetical protein DNTS_035544 [Danionella cerebrum]|uniref:FYVE-type domain-containing protein n=1 Tax=Danionella cerebrum TaxID=2873325 RepID=A0A553NRB7_9TELE|nr:hypothetical protein DNTS_035544 [Danionella translucida]